MNSNKSKRVPRRSRPDKPVEPEQQVENPKQANIYSRPTDSTPHQLPPPKFPAKKPSTPVNDPLWLEADVIEGEVGVQNDKAVRNFEVDAAGYTTLVEEEYRAISDVDKNFAKSVPLSAYNYFHQLLIWYRGALAAEKAGNSTQCDRNLITTIHSHELLIPAGAAAYLAGLGDFDDELGTRHRLRVKKPNRRGHFGRVDQATHDYYESLPTPAIAIQRVLEDYRFTLRGGSPEWDIPEIAPRVPLVAAAHEEGDEEEEDEDPPSEEEEERGVEPLPVREAPEQDEQVLVNKPIVNLLGWRLATKLERNQLAGVIDSLQRVPAHYTDMMFDIREYCLHNGLFEYVLRKLRAVQGYRMKSLPHNTSGSVCQQVIWQPGIVSADPNVRAIDQDGRATSHTSIPVRMVAMAKVMCYRSLRRPYHGINPWACYEFDKYRQVPVNWQDNRNTVIQAGLEVIFRDREYTGPYCSRKDAVVEYLNKQKLR